MAQTWTPLAVLEWTTKRFADASIGAARLEAQLIVAHALGCTRMQLYTGFDKPLAEPELASIRELIKRRLAGEPVAYLIGEHEFWGMPLAIDRSVLVPRPDTETLVEVAKQLAPAAMRVLDLCTGSGAIALALAKELPAARVIATELSPDAAKVARQNVAKHGLAVEVREGDLWTPVAGERFELIVSNPPYVATAVIDTLSPEVRREPRIALDGGPDGLAFYDRICAAARDHLEPGGVLAVEHGFDQADAVRARFEAAGIVRVTVVADLGKNPRVTSGFAP
ncbi:MAG TPA: peptide chain release factor N(5)-glutamine methyltransferase [Kofleriaceae bacterium]